MAKVANFAAIVMTYLSLPDIAWTQERVYEWGRGMHPVWWSIWGFAMMVVMLFFWIAGIVGLVIGIRWLLSQGRKTGPDSALKILRQRYARGEINKEEFETKKRDLLCSTHFTHDG